MALEDSESFSGRLQVLELYSGIGGIHWALKESGVDYDVVQAMDVNTSANAIYQHNFPDVTVCASSISKLSLEQLEKWSPNTILMSPPCQPFTRVGKKQDCQDPRTQSFLHLLQLITKVRHKPEYILVENVKGFEVSETRNMLLDMLHECKYAYQEFLLTPLQFGIPNCRMRYYLIAKARPLEFAFWTSDKILDNVPMEALQWLRFRQDQNTAPCSVGLSGSTTYEYCQAEQSDINARCSPSATSQEASHSPDHSSVAATCQPSSHSQTDSQCQGSLECGSCVCRKGSNSESNADSRQTSMTQACQCARSSNNERREMDRNSKSAMHANSGSHIDNGEQNRQTDEISGIFSSSKIQHQYDDGKENTKVERKSVSVMHTKVGHQHDKEDRETEVDKTQAETKLSCDKDRENTEDEKDVENLTLAEAGRSMRHCEEEDRLVCADGTRLDSYLEKGDAEYFQPFILSDKDLRMFVIMDVVHPSFKKSSCFTKRYGHYIEGAGSLIMMTDDVKVVKEASDFKAWAVEQKNRQQWGEEELSVLRRLHLRYFTPREVANLLCFPSEFEFPEGFSTIQCHRVLGNSLNVHIVSVLIRLMLMEPGVI